MSGLLWLFGLFAVASVVAYVGVAYMRRWAAQRMLDIPNERSSHTQPTPRGGGLLIVLVTLAGLWLATPFMAISLLRPALAAFSLGAALIAWISWCDDRRPLPSRVRFGAHAIGALAMIILVGSWQTVALPLLPTVTFGWLGVPLTFFWLVGLTNAYNFMDGIDGLAGGQAVVAGLGWLMLGQLVGLPLVSLLGVFVAGSSLGFLGHNWPPARIFMGDVGSAFLGFTLATLAVLGGLADARLPFAGVLLLWPFVFDTIFTILRRLRRGENIFAAHRSHLYQRLVIAGWRHRTVTLLYLGLALLGAGLALAWLFKLPGSALAASLLPPLCALLLWWGVVRVERHTAAA
ncbi:MAG: glycosyltransferase family 4 protein [Chloroflexi bacterium]|nr:glycosyltransferase family 4 protein [Chloroflexota bacterium]